MVIERGEEGIGIAMIDRDAAFDAGLNLIEGGVDAERLDVFSADQRFEEDAAAAADIEDALAVADPCGDDLLVGTAFGADRSHVMRGR